MTQMSQMIESSGKMIEEELAKAGTNPELIAKLKKDRITVDKELPDMEFLHHRIVPMVTGAATPPESGGNGGWSEGALVQTPSGSP